MKTREDLERENAELREKLAAYEEPAHRRERLQEIVGFLFPNYDARKGGAPGGLIHPDRAWWWNGAGIDENEVELGHKGDRAHCTVISYVGSNEYDRYELTVPAAWMDADDFRPLATTWIKEEKARRAEAKRRDELAKAEYEAQDAERRLAKLRSVDRKADANAKS